MNAPAAGTIKEFLVKEEDTVTVGQDLLRLELGGERKGEGQQKGKQEPNALGSDLKSTPSEPESEEGGKSYPQSSSQSQEEPKSAPLDQKSPIAKKQPPTREMPAPKALEPTKPGTKGTGNSPYGSREEQRVNPHLGAMLLNY